jgi:hypothetical protein
VIDFLPHGRSDRLLVDLASGGAAHECRCTVVLSRLRLVGVFLSVSAIFERGFRACSSGG